MSDKKKVKPAPKTDAAKENKKPTVVGTDGNVRPIRNGEVLKEVDGKVVVLCTDAAKVRLHADKHPTRVVRSADGTLTRAEFDIGNGYSYVRATVIDKDGKHAWTNPIFLK